MIRRVLQEFRTTFFAGILVGVPLAVTVWVGIFLVTFLESAIHLLPDQAQPQYWYGAPIPGLGVLLALTTVLLLGALTRSYVGSRIIDLYEYILSRVPLISSVYQGVKQLMEALFAREKGSFQQVVLVITCNSKLNTSGCAFSTSSSNTTACGFFVTASVSRPP